MSDWIKATGEKPDLPDDTLVECAVRNTKGDTSEYDYAVGSLDWTIPVWCIGGIVRYRVLEPSLYTDKDGWIKATGKKPNLPDHTKVCVRVTINSLGYVKEIKPQIGSLDWSVPASDIGGIKEYRVVGPVPHPGKIWDSEYLSDLIKADNYAEATRVCQARMKQIREAGL